MRWQESEGVRWLAADLPGARVAFSTRLGGISDGPFSSLNLGAQTGDAWVKVRANRRRLTEALQIDPGRVKIGSQLHGTELARHSAEQTPGGFTGAVEGLPVADGHFTSDAGAALLVFCADCLPLALWGRGGVAMLHCGWRGLSAGILARGVDAIEATHAAIGPAIGPCCYQVGAEVSDAFAALGDRICRGSKLDLNEVARQLLAAAGVTAVESAAICTSCEERLFFSHRRDQGQTGRQAGIAWINQGG